MFPARIGHKWGGFALVMDSWRNIVALILGGLLGIFALQNMASIELTFLVWTFESRRIVVIAASLIVGWFFGYASRR